MLSPRLILAASTLLPSLASAQTPFHPGMVVTHSVRVRSGVYQVTTSDSAAAIIVRGSNITIDLRGVELVGDTDREHPDRFAGVAVRIDGGRGITVRGLRARGFKLGIIARHVTQLRLLGNDLSYNWKPRLYSGIVKESLIDWLDYHQNDHDEWLRYGAGIYLTDVTGGELRDNTVVQGMNGLLMVRTDGVRVWNNNFSFNSGLGIGMYRSSSDTVMHNRIDWNVRGYSHGFYNRGQDSAGLLIYEQSCRNIVAYNSVTHSGDGLFLWAGQSTMDSGTGGANDNLFYRNDFSAAPTNGMEATFSRNSFVENTVNDSWHGLWGGYSYESVVLGNHFARNGEGIAIEHGQDNRIAGNVFDGDSTAIHLWANPIEPSDWGYPKHRDTRSRDYVIASNRFVGNRRALWVDNTRDVHVDGNRFEHVAAVTRLAGDTTGWSFMSADSTLVPTIQPALRVAPLRGGIDMRLPAAIPADRSGIIVDEWGPYDWRSPKLWPVGSDAAMP
ncbi:MAG: NosD domain-containing protein, partial [Gemmatimonadales bacterium]